MIFLVKLGPSKLGLVTFFMFSWVLSKCGFNSHGRWPLIFRGVVDESPKFEVTYELTLFSIKSLGGA
jgi:hypothetical protein